MAYSACRRREQAISNALSYKACYAQSSTSTFSCFWYSFRESPACLQEGAELTYISGRRILHPALFPVREGTSYLIRAG